MSDAAVFCRRNGAVIEVVDAATGRTVDAFGGAPGNAILAAVVTATLAQINAGLAIVAADANRTLIPVRFRMKCTGSFAALTDIRLSDTAASPVDIATLTQAAATDGTIASDAVTLSGLTIGAGFGVALTAGKGIQIRKTGSTGTTATSMLVMVEYLLA